jgi:hypothetical protein
LFCLHICAALGENRDKSLNVALKGEKKIELFMFMFMPQ